LDRAFEQMPQGYKTAFFLHDYADNSHEEIASVTGWSVGTSKSQLHKARRRLRKLLQYEHRKAAGPSMSGKERGWKGSVSEVRRETL
jgi:RNA polymerase sigma-70 factor (ECF subfamily)